MSRMQSIFRQCHGGKNDEFQTQSKSEHCSQASINKQSSTEADQSQSSPKDIEEGPVSQHVTSESCRKSSYERFTAWWNPWKVTDGRYDGFKSIQLESFPDGYPRLAALMDSDINTRLYRRFGLARNRLLLHKQDQIAALNEKLNLLDKADEISNPERLTCKRYDEELGDESKRSQLLQSLEIFLKDYDTLLLREHAIASLPKPTDANHRAIFDWVYNNKPVVREEYEYLYDRRDFLLLGNQHDDWQRSFQERLWNLSYNPLFKRFLSSKSRTSDTHSTYSSNRKANLIIMLFLASGMTALLMLPVVLLYVLDSGTGVKIAILLLFVLVFSAAILTMTKAKRHEAFAATAAYAAVLVVFLANVPTTEVK